VSHSRELGFDLLHADLHIDDRLGRVEKVAVARPGILLTHLTVLRQIRSTQQATAASLDCRRHCCEAVVLACERQVLDIGTRLPTIGKPEDLVPRSSSCSYASACRVIESLPRRGAIKHRWHRSPLKTRLVIHSSLRRLVFKHFHSNID
jgi:hypothetical protein